MNSRINRKKISIIVCNNCGLNFTNKKKLMQHCTTKEHEDMLRSNESHNWYWRAPPQNFKSELYRMCKNWKQTQSCIYGVQCLEAHGPAELAEWNKQLLYRKKKMIKAKEEELYGE